MRSTGFKGVAIVWVCTAFAAASAWAGGDATERHAPVILDGVEGEVIAFPPHKTRRLAHASQNVAGLSLFEIIIPARSGGAPPHTHLHEDEFFYVRSGTPTFMADGQRKTVSAGGFTLLPRASLHAVWNDSDEDAVLLVGTSQGKFDDFFDAVAIEVRKRGAATPGEVGQIMGQLGAERGIVIQMDKVPADVRSLYGMPEE